MTSSMPNDFKYTKITSNIQKLLQIYQNDFKYIKMTSNISNDFKFIKVTSNISK